jgi:hypothetical protein
MEEIQEQEDKIKLNESFITKSEFEKKKEEIKKMKNAKLIEVGKNEYKIRLFD